MLTTYDSIEGFVFDFLLLDLQLVAPNPMVIVPLVYLFMSLCIIYDASTYVNISSIFVAPKALFSLRVQWINITILFFFSQS